MASPEPQTTKFTEGPWTAEVRNVAGPHEPPALVGYVTVTTPYREIAVLYADESQSANARLIACAPELYAALTECSFRLAALVAASGDFSDINAKVLDQAAALLAKVEGR